VGVDDPDSTTPERPSRRSRLPGAPASTRPGHARLRLACCQYDAGASARAPCAQMVRDSRLTRCGAETRSAAPPS